MRWFVRVLLLACLVIIFASSVFALGVAPSSLQVDYVSGEVLTENILVVNTLEVPVYVDISMSEWVDFVSFLEIDGSSLELEANEEYSLVVEFDFGESVFLDDEFEFRFAEGALGDSMVGSSVTLNVPVVINGLEAFEETDVIALEETPLEESDDEFNSESEVTSLDTQTQDETEGREDLDSELVGNDLEKLSFSGENTNSGRLFFAIVLVILLGLFGHMLYRYLHPEHDF